MDKNATTVSEEVIDYDGHAQSSWFENKLRGLNNRYFIYKRKLGWKIHSSLNSINLDYSKIPATSTPIFINNYNRLELVKEMIDWLMNVDDEVSIIIVDNQSTYQPLLDFYNNIDHPRLQAVPLNFNSWRLGIAYLAGKLKDHDRYILSDPDLIPYPNTPKDIISHFSNMLDKYPAYNHVGASLELNDIPEDIPVRPKVIKHESAFWSPQAEKLNDEVYVANIDLTFAMYRNTSKALALGPALRTDRPYTLKHVDWYTKEEDYSEEYKNYLATSKSYATWAMQILKDKKEAQKS